MRARHLAALACVALPTPALAELAFCNQTDEVTSIAIGYRGDGGWTSEGWWNARPGSCVTVVEGDLTKTHYYYRFEGPGLSFDHDRYMFCTSNDVFTILGDEHCESRGFDREGFNEVEVAGRSDVTLDIVAQESETPGLFDSVLDTGPEVETDPPGTHGDPIVNAGVLSHCEPSGQGTTCFFVAENWVFSVTEGQPTSDATPPALIDDLAGRPGNTPMQFAGDLLGHEGRILRTTLRDFLVIAPDDFALDRAALQGDWVDGADDSFGMEIRGSLMHETFAGVGDEGAFLHFQTGCKGLDGTSTGVTLTARDGSSAGCFLILDVTDTQLSILWAGGNGVPVQFGKSP